MQSTQPDLVDTISSINHVSLNSPDLLNLALHYYEGYCKDQKIELDTCDALWNEPEFLEQVQICSREGLVMAIMAMSLDESVNFKEMLNQGLDINGQEERLNKILDVNTLRPFALRFCNFLRKQTFSYTYSQNKNFQSVSELSSNLLKERFNCFMNKFNTSVE